MLIVTINDKRANQATPHVNQWALIQNQKLVITSGWMAFNAA